jgi:hypothetical protein
MMLLIEIVHHLGQVQLLNKHALKMSVKSKDAFSMRSRWARVLIYHWHNKPNGNFTYIQKRLTIVLGSTQTSAQWITRV